MNMKAVIYLIVTTLTYPFWWITCKLLDWQFYCHEKLTKWVEK